MPALNSQILVSGWFLMLLWTVSIVADVYIIKFIRKNFGREEALEAEALNCKFTRAEARRRREIILQSR